MRKITSEGASRQELKEWLNKRLFRDINCKGCERNLGGSTPGNRPACVLNATQLSVSSRDYFQGYVCTACDTKVKAWKVAKRRDNINVGDIREIFLPVPKYGGPTASSVLPINVRQLENWYDHDARITVQAALARTITTLADGREWCPTGEQRRVGETNDILFLRQPRFTEMTELTTVARAAHHARPGHHVLADEGLGWGLRQVAGVSHGESDVNESGLLGFVLPLRHCLCGLLSKNSTLWWSKKLYVVRVWCPCMVSVKNCMLSVYGREVEKIVWFFIWKNTTLTRLTKKHLDDTNKSRGLPV